MKIYQHLLLVVDLRAGPGHEVEGEADEGHDPQQVGPDVAGLGVDPGSQSQLSIYTDSSQSPEDGGEALLEAGQRRPVALLQEVVILQQHEVTSYCSHWH